MADIIEEFVDELRIFLISLVHHVDGFIDENFLSWEVIMQNLIIEGENRVALKKSMQDLNSVMNTTCSTIFCLIYNGIASPEILELER